MFNHFKQIITTPLFYVNAKPHIGHLYSMIYADAIAKVNQTPLLTGTDEHGQKVYKSARDEPTQQYCDRMSGQFRSLADTFIHYDTFVRTTDKEHIAKVHSIWKKLSHKIYKDSYSGYYSLQEEAFVNYETTSYVTEHNYFYPIDQEFTATFIQQFKHKNELATHKLDKICISRPKERQQWGIPIDDQQNIYVWFDALCGYFQEGNTHYKHVIGKDILRFHAIIWPNILKELNDSTIELIVHDHWIKDGRKMSKSLNNVVDPLELLEKYTPNQIKLYFLAEGPQSRDVSFSEQALEQTWNDYVDQFNNILYRLLNPKVLKPNIIEYKVDLKTDDVQRFTQQFNKCQGLMKDNKFVETYIELKKLFQIINGYIAEHKPWITHNEQVLATTCIFISMTQQILKYFVKITKVIQPEFNEFPNEDTIISVNTEIHKQLLLKKFII